MELFLFLPCSSCTKSERTCFFFLLLFSSPLVQALLNQIWAHSGDNGQLCRQQPTRLKQTERSGAQSHHCDWEWRSAGKTISCESAPEDWRWAAVPHKGSASQPPCLQNTSVCSGRWETSRSRVLFWYLFWKEVRKGENLGPSEREVYLQVALWGELLWAECAKGDRGDGTREERTKGEVWFLLPEQ